MTDAERWRRIAKSFEDGTNEHQGLCCSAGYLYADDHPPAHVKRMRAALDAMYEPERGGFFWWNIDQNGTDQRILAACFLAAMAEADGGNHKVAP